LNKDGGCIAERPGQDNTTFRTPEPGGSK